ncbi:MULTISPECIES: DegT/DnrJ/EryC1/StrS family aminotransferase [Streptomyces]|uniref:DegT/DnrJ/EryC1/StrS family aminotransferase n=1 Tax=Streptomyces TaxID=1883 RepID=UPI0004CCFCF8|nr:MULTISPECIES: DegT/DnrJ/EryC1/StrS family aminotransferase [Streptomyces]MBK3583668.1 DegT/DnrJ/EryC1/StrS family aminotransferase [Streptomyces sp. MBT57]OXZ01546.1 glutamine--scyllo-inositol aminotransferase [Streptomyces sp. 2R]QQZ52888.1 DegT/DnrJ/EryC1/StrS family aminotransferase [Streptomyces microflavus]WSR89978.1 DegT/DnrJ/EryC1/StrS family aminotransferase [Streptomyces microflavus]WTF67972.1 DegT/DnrJ/EryC1/StrS family aminotransferase [Streptomyces microflavus]
MINLFQPQVGAEELDAVAQVFDSNWLGHGPRTKAFESAFADHIGVGADHVIFLNSGTAGLFLALETLDLREGDEVVLPSLSFLAAANAILACGARPVFCDVDARTLNPTLEDVESVLTSRTKAVVVLHYGGYPGDIARIAERCRQTGITLVEDAACSVASTVDGQAVGTFGDLAMWSFDAMKVLVTGDGGMLYVRDPEQAARARRLAYHGLSQPSGFGYAKVSARWWELDVPEIGRRVVGNDLTAAIGTVQLRRLPAFVARRKEIVDLYNHALAGVDGLLLPPDLPYGHTSTHYFYWVQTAPGVRDEVASDLIEAGIYTTFRYAALHKVPAYRSEGRELPQSDQASDRTLCLPLHPGLEDADVRTVAAAVRKAVESHRP